MAIKPTYEKLRQRVKDSEKQALEPGQMHETLTPKTEELSLSNIVMENTHSVGGRYSIKDLINIESLRKILENFYQATGFVTTLAEYPSQEILIAAGWRDICSRFHRAFPESLRNCRKSNIYLTEQLKELKELNIRLCENGLMDGATPIVIKGRHLASLFTGQVFFQKPDIEWFKKQAETYAYDFDAYLEALNKVPVVSEDQFKSVLSFLNRLAVTIAETGFTNLELREKSSKLEEEIVERKRAEEALRKSEERYSGLLENLEAGIVVHAPDTSIVMNNSRASELLGLSEEQMKGKEAIDPTWKFLDRDSNPLPLKEYPVNQIMSSGKPIENQVFGVIRSVAKDIVWLTVNGFPVLDDTGEISEILISFIDITERERAQEELQESTKKIKLFAYSVAHDLKNPAISIYGLTKRLSRLYMSVLDEKGKEYCGQIVKASEQIAGLAENINVYISTKEAPITIETVNLKELFRMVREEIASQLSIRKIKWSQPDYLAEIKADRLSIVRVIRNLVDNALKYGGDDLSKISIGYQETYEYHILSVMDDGIGLKMEDSKDIFDSFKRTKTSRGIEGTGLGLAIVKEIAERHAGKIWIKPGAEKGVEFSVSISRNLQLFH